MNPTRTEAAIEQLRVDETGKLVVPSHLLDMAGLECGDSVEVEFTLEGILLVPVRSVAEIEAFWGANWRAQFEQADTDVNAGRTTAHASDEEFLAALRAESHAHARGD